MDATRKHAPAGWLEALAESEAELAAGQTIPMDVVLGQIDAAIDRLTTKRKSPQERRQVAHER
jgi:hypothetical protein